MLEAYSPSHGRVAGNVLQAHHDVYYLRMLFLVSLQILLEASSPSLGRVLVASFRLHLFENLSAISCELKKRLEKAQNEKDLLHDADRNSCFLSCVL